MTRLIVELDGRPRRIDDPRARPVGLPPVTPVPLGPPELAGLTQIDGEVVPVLRAGAVRDDATAVLTETPLGRVVLLCGRVLSEHTPGVEPLAVEALVEALRHAVRG